MIQPLRGAGSGLRRALENLGRCPIRAALVTGSIAVSLFLVGAVYLAARNVDSATGKWGHGVQMVVYLEDGMSAEHVVRIAGALAEVPAVEKVEHISSAVAFERLQASLGEHDDLVAGVEEGMLPASLEVTLHEGLKEVASVHPMVERLRATPGVEEVEFLGAWVDKLTSLNASLRYAGWFLFVLVGLACVYTVTTTLRASVQTREREMETLALLGASDRFVRGPLLLEGVLQGVAGAGIAAGALWLLFRSTSETIERALASSIGEIDAAFLPGAEIVAFVAIGAGFGLVGSWLATGRRVVA